jgi:hypothetical protein
MGAGGTASAKERRNEEGVAGGRRNETRRKGDETGMTAFGRGGKKKDERR